MFCDGSEVVPILMLKIRDKDAEVRVGAFQYIKQLGIPQVACFIDNIDLQLLFHQGLEDPAEEVKEITETLCKS